MSETELMPCPFCGKAVQHRFALWPCEGDTDGIIHAEPTDCPLTAFNTGTADGGTTIAAAWNRRSPVAEGGGWRTIDSAPTAEEFDANVDRLKACEHIADGDEGWEALRNLCPSTAAVARLRDRLASRPFLVCQECRHLIGCVQKRQCRRAPSQEGASDTGDGSGASKASEPPPTPR